MKGNYQGYIYTHSDTSKTNWKCPINKFQYCKFVFCNVMYVNWIHLLFLSNLLLLKVGVLLPTTQKPIKRQQLVKRKVSFISEASNGRRGGGRTPVQRSTPPQTSPPPPLTVSGQELL